MMMSSSPLVSSSITNGGNQAADVELQRENGVAAEPSDNGHTNNHNMEPTTKDNDSTSNTTKEAADAKAATGEDKENAPPNGDQATLDESMKNESSTLSTAFTISFEDDAPVSSSKKQFGIRDSIRKFAPPKPHTIEKPRPSKSDQQGNQDNSYMSIESAPGGCPGSARQTFRRDPTNSSCRSSGRKSDSSRHSNISESAAFLIDKMLNCKQGESLSSLSLSEQKQQKDNRGKGGIRSRGGSGATPGKKLAHSSDDILDDEIDFCEERSDNGTYIVGTDPESDAARRKIDELFGVVKAAEASLMKQASAGGGGGRVLAGGPPVARPSRLPDKRPTMSRERQEHINRLAGAGRHSSRSSSSSRQELASTSHRRRESRNSSCDRASKLPSSRHRRATSQSSRQSSSGGINHHDPSDGDTQSSRSSLQNEIEPSSAGASSAAAAVAGAAQNPSMKFNRAFALRRARLGLGEPAPLPRMGSNASNGQLAMEPESLNLSPRRTLAQRYANHQSSSGGQQQQQQSMSRNDGGRFSLRMRNNPVPSRLMQGVGGGQQATIIDSYLSKVVSSSKGSTSRFNRSPGHVAAAASGHALPYYHQNQSVHSTSAIVAGPPLYQSSDELELLPSPSQSAGGYRSLQAKSLAARRENLSELEADIDYATNSSDKFNYSLNLEQITANTGGNNSRLCNSAGRRGSSGQLGALDCLVISAISSLSVKIRGSVCDLMVEHAKRLPEENETRLIVEEILPQLAAANSSRPKSPTSIEEIDQSLYFDLAQALKNLKKVEQMVDVMKQISSQIPATADHSPSQTEGGGGGGGCSSSSHNSNSKSPNHLSSHSTRHHHNNNHSNKQAAGGETGGSESNPNSESTSMSPT